MSVQPEPTVSLSSTDRTLLIAALEDGYFEEQPRTSIPALAAAHGLSERETKRRLARGLSVLLQRYRSSEESLPDGLVEEPLPWHASG